MCVLTAMFFLFRLRLFPRNFKMDIELSNQKPPTGVRNRGAAADTTKRSPIINRDLLTCELRDVQKTPHTRNSSHNFQAIPKATHTKSLTILTTMNCNNSLDNTMTVSSLAPSTLQSDVPRHPAMLTGSPIPTSAFTSSIAPPLTRKQQTQRLISVIDSVLDLMDDDDLDFCCPSPSRQ